MLAALTVASTVAGSVASNARSKRVGSTNQAGLIQDFNRRGFIPAKCIAELVANSCDAQSPKAIFKENREFIKLVDMGIGMDEEKITKMFDLFRANHKLDRTMGVSGLGGKNALFILSKKDGVNPSTVLIFTKSPDGEYLRVTVPWETIIEQEIWDGQIAVDKMSEEEIADFKKERETEDFQHGTTIQFEYSDVLMDLLNSQFNKTEREKIAEFNNRLDIIFGHSGVDIVLEKSDGTPRVTLPKYKHFGDTETHYYAGKNIELIEHYVDRDGKDRFIWVDAENNDIKEIKQTSKNTRNAPDSVVVHQTWKHIGTYEVFNGMRRDSRIFNEASPAKLNSATFYLTNYDEKFFKIISSLEQLKEYLPQTKLYRNGQYITEFNLEGPTASTSRAGAAALLKTFHHRTEVHYTTVSSQDNRMDIAMGIQGNKNQHQREFPKTFLRLLKYLKTRNYKKIDAHFDLVIENHNKQKAEAYRIAREAKVAEEDGRKQRLASVSEIKAAAEARRLVAASVPAAKVAEEDGRKQRLASVSEIKAAASVPAEIESDSDDSESEEYESAVDKSDSESNNEQKKEKVQSSETETLMSPKLVIVDSDDVSVEPEPVQLITKKSLLQFINERFNDDADSEKIKAIHDFVSKL
jgi:hypothetical protein